MNGCAGVKDGFMNAEQLKCCGEWMEKVIQITKNCKSEIEVFPGSDSTELIIESE